MKKLAFIFVAALLLAQLLVAAPSQAATPFSSPLPPAINYTSNITIPTDINVYVPCALGGQGEEVLLSGDLHVLWHFTVDPAGGYHYQDHYQPQNITGVGLASGTKYTATGITRDGGRAGALPYSFTYVNNFRIIGQGPGNNYLLHETVHMTINANGELTAYADNYSVDCK